MSPILIAVMILGSVSGDYYFEEDYYNTYDQIYRRQDDFDTVRVIDEGISNILSALPGQVRHQHFVQSVCRMYFKVREARDAAAVATAKANRLSLSYGLGVAIGTALTIQVRLRIIILKF